LIMYIGFIMFGKIVLLNMFVMLVMSEFEALRSDPKNQSNDYEALDHLGSKALKIFKRYRRHHLPNIGFPDAQHTSLACDQLEAKMELLGRSLNTLCWNLQWTYDVKRRAAKKIA
uniref:Ion_trans domain-containing protein n=1 Tax=Anisakis simplex TaxID=6269 RepID=A0A0M3J8Z5_ANISI